MDEGYRPDMEERRLVPIGPAQLTYIPFKYAGRVRIFVKLVWVDSYREGIKNPSDWLSDRYCTGNRHQYHHDMLTWDGHDLLDEYQYFYEEDWLAHPDNANANSEIRTYYEQALAAKKAALAKTTEHSSARLDVVVPEGCFAKEPPAWLQKWVNLYSDSDDIPYDECEFRKKCVFAFSLQPIMVVINYLCRLIVATGLLSVGMRGINYRPLWDIFDASIADIGSNLKGSMFYPEWDRKIFQISFWPIRAIPLSFSPLTLIGSASFIWYFSDYDSGMIAILTGKTALAWSLAAAIVSAVAVAVMWTLGLLIEAVTQKGIKQRDVERKRAVDQTDHPWYLQERAIATLACEGRPLPTRVADLPKEQQTIWLRLLDFKAKVCRPYALK